MQPHTSNFFTNWKISLLQIERYRTEIEWNVLLGVCDMRLVAIPSNRIENETENYCKICTHRERKVNTKKIDKTSCVGGWTIYFIWLNTLTFSWFFVAVQTKCIDVCIGLLPATPVVAQALRLWTPTAQGVFFETVWIFKAKSVTILTVAIPFLRSFWVVLRLIVVIVPIAIVLPLFIWMILLLLGSTHSRHGVRGVRQPYFLDFFIHKILFQWY